MGGDPTPLIEDALSESTQVLGADIAYDEELFTRLNLPDFAPEDFIHNDAKLDTHSLDEIIEEGLRPHRSKGLKDPELTDFLQDVAGGAVAHDILCNGARSFMDTKFKPNGGRECSVGGSYLKYRPICNDALLQLVREGKALAFSRDALLRAGPWMKCT